MSTTRQRSDATEPGPELAAEHRPKMIENVSRRGFLKGVLSTGALVLSVHLLPREASAAAPISAGLTQADRSTLHPSAFVGVDTEGTVYIVAHRSEMGTGIRTSLPLVVADELDADWKRVRIEQAIGDWRYGGQDTDGSHSIRDFFGVMREAGATARLMLVEAAAARWNVAASECETGLHEVIHRRTGRRLGTARWPLPPQSSPCRIRQRFTSRAKVSGATSAKGIRATTSPRSAAGRPSTEWTFGWTGWSMPP